MNKLAVLTSGGDAPGMNAAIRAVVRTAAYEGVEIYGVRRGFCGLIKGEMERMQPRSVAGIIHRGGTILLTARCEEFKDPEVRAAAVENLRRRGIEGLVVIGGDGSLRGALALADLGLAVAGVPATIDNDLGLTEATLGFDTAVNTVVEAVNHIRDTATAHERTFVIEAMGRDAGHIALYAGLAAGAESILVPEMEYDLEAVARGITSSYEKGKRHSIIIVAEGAVKAYEVAEYLEGATGLETRVVVLGYIQRGGSPTARDRILASRMGAAAVEGLLAGERSFMTAVRGPEVVRVPIADALAQGQVFRDDMLRLASILAL